MELVSSLNPAEDGGESKAVYSDDSFVVYGKLQL